MTKLTKASIVKDQRNCSAFIKTEESRYERKGYGLLVAATIAFGFFVGVPWFGQKCWASIMEWADHNKLTYTSFFLLWATMQHNLMHLVCNLSYSLFYQFEFPFIEKYKSTADPWPWHSDPEKWNSLIKKAYLVFFINSNILANLFVLLLDSQGAVFQHPTSVEELPSPLKLAATITFCMFCEDFCFHFSHRFLHWKPIYPYIHKMHHEFIQPVGIASEYAHPIEFLLGNLIPTSIGPMLLGEHMHLLSVFAWMAVRVGETLDGHCGYEFSFSPYRLIPFSGSAEYHNWHHSENIGNYSSFFSIWDSVFGTNKAFFKHIKERQAQSDLLKKTL